MYFRLCLQPKMLRTTKNMDLVSNFFGVKLSKNVTKWLITSDFGVKGCFGCEINPTSAQPPYVSFLPSHTGYSGIGTNLETLETHHNIIAETVWPDLRKYNYHGCELTYLYTVINIWVDNPVSNSSEVFKLLLVRWCSQPTKSKLLGSRPIRERDLRVSLKADLIKKYEF